MLAHRNVSPVPVRLQPRQNTGSRPTTFLPGPSQDGQGEHQLFSATLLYFLAAQPSYYARSLFRQGRQHIIQSWAWQTGSGQNAEGIKANGRWRQSSLPWEKNSREGGIEMGKRHMQEQERDWSILENRRRNGGGGGRGRKGRKRRGKRRKTEGKALTDEESEWKLKIAHQN